MSGVGGAGLFGGVTERSFTGVSVLPERAHSWVSMGPSRKQNE